jgi:hypothetical protein
MRIFHNYLPVGRKSLSFVKEEMISSKECSNTMVVLTFVQLAMVLMTHTDHQTQAGCPDWPAHM